MATILGDREFRYEVIDDWAKLPDGWSFHEVCGVGVDGHDNVYVFNRGDHPMIVFDRQGNFLRSWGEGVFEWAHGLRMGPDDTIYLTDGRDHTVRKFTLDGELLLTLGTPGAPSAFMSGQPFNQCTNVAIAPDGDLYVADGYGNARVHRFSPDGKLKESWGACGTGDGEFNIVHDIWCDAEGWLYVADRENHRIQIFDGDGLYETQWNRLHRPGGLYMVNGAAPVWFVAELGPAIRTTRNYPNLGPRVSILDARGNLLARLGGLHPGLGPDEFIGPHAVATDSHGDLYIGEVSRSQWMPYWPDDPIPDDLRSFRKLRKVQ